MKRFDPLDWLPLHLPDTHEWAAIVSILVAVGRAFFERRGHEQHGKDVRLALLDRDIAAQAQLTELQLLLQDIAAMEVAVKEHEAALGRFAVRTPKAIAESMAMRQALTEYATAHAFGQPDTMDRSTYEELVTRADELVDKGKEIDREITAETEQVRHAKDNVRQLRGKLMTALRAQRTVLRTIRATTHPSTARSHE